MSEKIVYFCNDAICPVASVDAEEACDKPMCPKCGKPMSEKQEVQPGGFEPKAKTDLVAGEISRYIRRKMKDMPSIGYNFQMWHKNTKLGALCEINKEFIRQMSKALTGKVAEF